MKKTKQIRVLRELLRNKERMTVPQLENMTEMRKSEIYNAIHDLKNRGLIKIDREIGKIGYKSPPKGKIFVGVNENSIKRIKYLIKKEYGR